MNIRTRLFLAFLFLTALPLSVVGYAGLDAIERASTLTVAESVEQMKNLGEEAIRQMWRRRLGCILNRTLNCYLTRRR